MTKRCTPTRTTVNPLPPAPSVMKIGKVTRKISGPDLYRDLKYSVAGDHYLVGFDCPAKDGFSRKRTLFEGGLELINGFAYVKIDRVDTRKSQALTPTPEEILMLAAGDPESYLPVVLGGLHNALVELDSKFAKGSWAAIELAMVQSFAEISKNRGLLKLLESKQRPAWLEQRVKNDPSTPRLRALAEQLLAEPAIEANWLPPEGLTQEAVAMSLLLESSVSDKDLPEMTKRTKYPFVISNRTIGGAEGTEIVVYSTVNSPGNTADVFYFYLWSSTEETMVEIITFECGRLAPRTTSIPIGHYAHIPLVKTNGKWCGNTRVETGEINAIADATAARAAFDAAVHNAFINACRAGIGPREGETYLGVTFTCPSPPKPKTRRKK